MAIIDSKELANPILDGKMPDGSIFDGSHWENPWDGHSGKEVESYITKLLKDSYDNLITGMKYENSTLTLFKREGDPVEALVSVEEPIPSYGIKLYGININGTDYPGNGTTITTQYTSKTKVKLGVIMFAVSQTSAHKSDMIGPFDVKISYGAKSDIFKVNNVKYEDCIIDNDGSVSGITDTSKIVWIDITSLFTTSSNGASITAVILKNANVKNTLKLNIINQKIDLTYTNDIILDNNVAQFTLTGGLAGKYHLEGFNNGKSIDSGSLTLSGLTPGLNQIIVCAVHEDDASIKSEYITMDLIYSAGVTDTVIAINKVNDTIPNNGVATLYLLTVYSPNKESISLLTFLYEDLPDGDEADLNYRVKYEVLNPSVYDDNNKYITSYQKYIELVGGNNSRYLKVDCNGTYYKFYLVFTDSYGKTTANSAPYKAMIIEEIDTSLLPYQGIDPNLRFDLSTGSANNVIITPEYAEQYEANVNPNIESSDGWAEEGGRTLFRMSAQELPIFINGGIDAKLSDHFSIELGFKTYNISNPDLPIMTLGKLQLRPTLLCWDTDDASAFKDRNSLFLSDREIHLLITVDGNHKLAKSDKYYPSYLGGDYLTTFNEKVDSLSYNFLKVYVNGVIDREVVLENAELLSLQKSLIQFNPKGADIDLYLFKVYSNAALPDEAVVLNYTSFLKTKEEKVAFVKANDITDSNTGVISFDKCYGKYNTLVLVLPKGARFPNRAWGKPDGEAKKDFNKFPATLFINYADPEINKEYGGRMTDVQYQGQGSSAMRYLIWNVQTSCGKFKDKQVNDEGQYLNKQGEVVASKDLAADLKRISAFVNYSDANFDPDTNRFKPEATTTIDNGYKMPPYAGQRNLDNSKVKKLVGKVNFASSMQSHKLGAVRLFDDAYAAIKDIKALNGGRKACNEEPFIYFYWESDKEPNQASTATKKLSKNKDLWKDRSENSIQRVELAELFNNDAVKFMGFLTWGSGKCDDATYAYDENLTPGYVLIEGGENTEPVCNFKIPWHALQRAVWEEGKESAATLDTIPTISKEDSIKNPWDNLLIKDESIVEKLAGAWDIDYGLDELKDEVNGQTYFKFLNTDPVHKSVDLFRRFQDFVYKHDYTYKVTNELEPDLSTWESKFKYVLSKAGSFKSRHKTYSGCQKGDMFRYDAATDDWVPAGLYYDFNAKLWERFNIYTEFDLSPTTFFDDVRKNMRNAFEQGIGEFVDTDDVSYHQAFVKFLSGTDNRAKNTYFQILGELYKKNEDYNAEDPESKEYIPDPGKAGVGLKIRFQLDDLDTILLTDNNGLQSKDYNLVEDSFRETPIWDETKVYDTDWGDANSAFFFMYDQCFEADIKKKLNSIIKTAFDVDLNVNNDNNYFGKNFFGIQTYYPAIAYNHTSQIYYENAKYVYDSKCIGSDGTPLYGNNNIDPIKLVHGSGLSAEREFMSKRLTFLATYAESSKLGAPDMNTDNSAGNGSLLRVKMKMIPYQDFYPLMQWNMNTTPINIKDSRTDELLHKEYLFATIEKRVKADLEYDITIAPSTPAINQGLYNVNLYKKLEITGLRAPSITANFPHLTDFEIDNSKLYTSTGKIDKFYGEGYPELNLLTFTSSMPVLERLSLKNIQLADALDLSICTKLKELDLTNAKTKRVIFPQSGRFKNAILPETITTFELYDNNGIESITFEGITNLETIYIQCDKVGQFNVNEFVNSLTDCGALKSVTLRGLETNPLYVTEDVLTKLCLIEKCSILGTVVIVTDLVSKQEASISLNTKKLLILKFGNFTASSSQVKFLYQSEEVTSANVSCESEVSLYTNIYPSSVGNPFGLTINVGNDIAIVNNGSTPVLNITYTMSNNAYAKIPDKYSGEVYLEKAAATAPEDAVAKVTITVTRDNRTSFTLTSTVKFAWSAPKLGDFVYADKSYSSTYIASKNMIGMIYAVDNTTSTSGTAYVIGKEFVSAPTNSGGRQIQTNHLGFVSGGDANSLVAEIKDIAAVLAYLESLGINEHYTVTGKSSFNTLSLGKAISDTFDNLTYSSKDVPDLFDNTKFAGKKDTLIYIEHVGKLLAKLWNHEIGRLQITRTDDGEYKIDSIQKLNELIRVLRGLNSSLVKATSAESTIIESILFPYFYSTYLYLPEGDNIDTAFEKGNWYVPSVYELARVLYYRGISTDDYTKWITAANIREKPIFPRQANKNDTIYTKPIFSNALALNVSFDCWNILAGSQSGSSVDNITTTVTDDENFGYQSVISGYYPNTTTTNKWVSASYNEAYSTSSWYDDVKHYQNVVRITRGGPAHRCVPFTQFDFSKE